METSIRMDRNVPVEMRDGTVLRADIYRPEDRAKHPAILIRTPYNKLLSGNSDFLNVVDAAHAGYAVIIQDIRFPRVLLAVLVAALLDGGLMAAVFLYPALTINLPPVPPGFP